MGVPEDVGDLRFYEGDGTPLRFEIRPQVAPFDLTGSTFTVTVDGIADDDLVVTVEEAVDDADAVVGADVVVTLTPDQQRAMRRITGFDVAEAGRWDQTLITGRLVKKAEVPA